MNYSVAAESSIMPEFREFKKIPRYNREVIVTEKIDGTNAQVMITEDGQVLAGSRNRWLSADADNFGFHAWVTEHSKELRQLGVGRHFGEWWGKGIQRGYNQSCRRFSLFNTERWEDSRVRPACCDVVPILWRGMFCEFDMVVRLHDLTMNGSRAAPGFMDPEGIVIFHAAGNTGFKVTLKNDHEPKSRQVK